MNPCEYFIFAALNTKWLHDDLCPATWFCQSGVSESSGHADGKCENVIVYEPKQLCCNSPYRLWQDAAISLHTTPSSP